jgi:3',5'-cyclic AMP phosphodiesterase CpdA
MYSPDVVRSLAKGLRTHSDASLQAMLMTVDRLVQGRGNDLVMIIQSGDISAYGAEISVSNATGQTLKVEFPAFDYWLSRCAMWRASGAEVVNMFGNHDLWPGTLPAIGSPHISLVERQLRAMPEFRPALPDLQVFNTSTFDLEIYRVNTVQSSPVHNTFAAGKIATDFPVANGHRGVYPASCMADPMEELATLAAARRGGRSNPVIRVLAMHHPPHFCNATGDPMDIVEGPLRNADELNRALSRERFHLVVAGHRHLINPVLGTTHTFHPGGQPHPPLPPTMLQLVAGTPTQAVDPDDNPPSFSVYRLRVDGRRGRLQLDRTIYQHASDLDSTFTPEPVEPTLRDLPV